LIANEGFYASKENAFVLLWKDKTGVDLLPFGAIADEEGTVRVQGTQGSPPFMYPDSMKYMKRDCQK
jgi:hypothetical protein